MTSTPTCTYIPMEENRSSILVEIAMHRRRHSCQYQPHRRHLTGSSQPWHHPLHSCPLIAPSLYCATSSLYRCSYVPTLMHTLRSTNVLFKALQEPVKSETDGLPPSRKTCFFFVIGAASRVSLYDNVGVAALRMEARKLMFIVTIRHTRLCTCSTPAVAGVCRHAHLHM